MTAPAREHCVRKPRRGRATAKPAAAAQSCPAHLIQKQNRQEGQRPAPLGAQNKTPRHILNQALKVRLARQVGDRTSEVGAVLTGRVIGSLLQTLAVLVLVAGVSLALGFRSHASALEWLAAAGVLALFAFALIWLSAALGLAAKSVETASNTPMFLTLLPLLSSAFVATAT